MEKETYLVYILHYLNPHIIWVQAKNPKGDVLEQVGLYGILPMKPEFEGIYDDYSDNYASNMRRKTKIITTRCKEWMPAVNLKMCELFKDAVKFYFTPIYEDGRNSIFDDNIHKYGEITVVSKSGEKNFLSKILEETIFASRNEELFHKELGCGLNTKLDEIAILSVIKQLKATLNKQVDQTRLLDMLDAQTSVFRIAHCETNELRERLLMQNHDKEYTMSRSDIENIITSKWKDFECCKGLKSKSTGRANLRNHTQTKESSMTALLRIIKMRSKASKVDNESQNTNTTGDIERQSTSAAVDIERYTSASPVIPDFRESGFNKKTLEYNPEYSKNLSNNTELTPTVVDKAQASKTKIETAKEEPKEPLKNAVKEIIPSRLHAKPNSHIKHEQSQTNNVAVEKSIASKESNQSEPVSASEQCYRILMARKILLTKEIESRKGRNSSNIIVNTESIESDSDNESTISDVVKRLELDVTPVKKPQIQIPELTEYPTSVANNNVNPFRNVDVSVSKFIEKLVTPVLMVHSKTNKRIQPTVQLRNLSFTTEIHVALANMLVKKPMVLQTISWSTILRGYSLFMIGPSSSGKTVGYTPSVCRLVSDNDYVKESSESQGPICIIICATGKSAVNVQQQCRNFLGSKKTVLTCYPGVDEDVIRAKLMNGCDIFVCTPSALARLMNINDFAVDLRRLSIFVLDDCERLEIYKHEVKFFLLKIKDMLKNRINKEHKVQYVLASRIWCDFMSALAKKAPNTVVCISSYQECVVYSQAQMSVKFILNNKVDAVVEFINTIDKSKRSIIVCGTDDEVDVLTKTLKRLNYIVFAADNKMSVESLYKLSSDWSDYEDPIMAPILVCCDANLAHVNITNAHNLLHYALPDLFSTFCKRFSTLVDNYKSIFNASKNDSDGVKICILLEEHNAKQLPKIVQFVKRCTTDVPEVLENICENILKEKDHGKADILFPICDQILSFGDCADYWNCKARHGVFKEFDEPEDWVPKSGQIMFTILHFHDAVTYSARLKSCVANGTVQKYPQTYGSLSLKMSLYYSNVNRRVPHGIPKVGDICAVNMKLNHFERCQVVKILSSNQCGRPNSVLVKLIDEEKWERVQDVLLYHLPEEYNDKSIKSYVVQVKFAGLLPKDRDINFSDLARIHLQKLIQKEDNLYMRADVVMSIGNTVIVNNLEACQDLAYFKEVVVRYNFKEELNSYAVPNPQHISKLQDLCAKGGITVCNEIKKVAEIILAKQQTKPRWAHLENDDFSLIYFASAESPDKFFIRLVKFQDSLNYLTKDIQKYIEDKNVGPILEIIKDIYCLAKFPDDSLYYRARIDEIVDERQVKCFFVDHGDWRYVLVDNIVEIPDNFITRMPFQAIECRLVGIMPAGENWTEFSTNWFCDLCFQGQSDDLKELYVNYYTKEKAECTFGHKYGIIIIDTTESQDVILNRAMVEANFAQENKDEIHYLNDLHFKRTQKDDDSLEDSWEKECEPYLNHRYERKFTNNEDKNSSILDTIFAKQPIRSVPLVESDDDSSVSDGWEFGPDDMKYFLKNVLMNSSQATSPTNSFVQLQALADSVTNDTGRSNTSSRTSDFALASPSVKLQETLSDDNSSLVKISPNRSPLLAQKIVKKPKLRWHQTKYTVIVKIEVTETENYQLEIKEASLKFSATTYGSNYAFELDLYCIVDPKKSNHASKGLYIYVKLAKRILVDWLRLTKDGQVMKWIAYDPDSIGGASSGEDDDDLNHSENRLKKIIENAHYNDSDMESLCSNKYDELGHFENDFE